MHMTELIARAGELLLEAGWTKSGMVMTVNGISAPVYEKKFETINGTQTAFAWASPSTDGEALMFGGSYYSEGRNVLVACSAYSIITDVTLKHITAEFALRDCVEKSASRDRRFVRASSVPQLDGIMTKSHTLKHQNLVDVLCRQA